MLEWLSNRPRIRRSTVWRLAPWAIAAVAVLVAISALVADPGSQPEPAEASRGLVGGTAPAAKFAASEAGFIEKPGTSDYERVAALSALNVVQANISAPRYGALNEAGRAPVEVDEVWARGAGICQGASDAYQAVMTELGVPTRRLEIYWVDHNGVTNSHATVETRWGGAWHWTDPTWGAFYTEPGDPESVLSFAEVRSSAEKRLRVNDTGPWWLEQRRLGNDTLGFAEWPKRKVHWIVVEQASLEIPKEAEKLPPLTTKEATLARGVR